MLLMNFKSKISFVYFFLFSIISFAQTGVVRGTIKDASTNEDIIGATVKIDGSTMGSATDINGFFSISKVHFFVIRYRQIRLHGNHNFPKPGLFFHNPDEVFPDNFHLPQ